MRTLLFLLLLSAAPPNPNNLAPNWWQTFQEDVGPNLEETKTRLAVVADNLSGDAKQEATALAAQITSNLDEWNRLRTVQPPTAATPPLPKPTYTFEEMIALGNQYALALQAKSSAQDEEQKWLTRSLAVQQERGRAKIEYEASTSGTTSHLLLGLRIMHLRSEQALYDAHQTLALKAFQAATTESEALDTLFIQALTRTEISPAEQTLIDANVKIAKEARYTYEVTPHPVDDPQDFLLQLALIDAEAKQSLAKLITGAVTNGDASRQLANWEDQLKRIPKEVPREQIETILSPLRLALAQHTAKEATSWSKTVAWTKRTWARASNKLDHTLFELDGTPFTLLKLLKALLILIIGFVISKLARFALNRWGQKKPSFSKGALYSLRRVLHYVIIVIAIFFALAALGFSLNQLLIVIGALSIGIGFGLQKVAANFIAGLTILLGRKIKVGDFVELESNHVGRVKAIHFQHSVIHTFDGRDIIVPNGEIIAHYLINWTMQDPFRRVSIPFTAPYGTDKELVRRIVLEAADKVPFTVKGHNKMANPNVRITEFGDNGLSFELIVWINFIEAGRYGHVTALFFWELETALRENGIDIPFPQRTLHFPDDQPE